MKRQKIDLGSAFLFFPFVAILVTLILLASCSTVKKSVSKSSFGYEVKKDESKEVTGLRKYDLSNTVSKDSSFDNTVIVEEDFTTDSVPKLIKRKTTTTVKGTTASLVAAISSRYDSTSLSVKAKIDSSGYFKSSVKNVKRSGGSLGLYLWLIIISGVLIAAYKFFNITPAKIFTFLKNQLGKL